MRAICIGLLGVGIGACGGGGGGVPASCGTTAPCGGDVVGTWVPDGSCVNQASIQATYMNAVGLECPAGSMVSIVEATSDWARVASMFDVGGTYSGTATFSATVAIAVPAACLVSRTCAGLDADFRSMVDPAGGIAAASCTDGGTACTCSITQQLSRTDTGTYQTSGNTLTLMPAGRDQTDTPYCVRGSELHLLALDGADQIASDIVLAKR
ncbi:MAG TPA: hypothetical protein VKQ32_22705 [Polyangia bacterium]|nr:hypothetical protein [Polyangia bacterium]